MAGDKEEKQAEPRARRRSSGAARDGAAAARSAAERADANEAHVRLTEDMMAKLSAFARGELEASAEDYELLARLNGMTSEEYRAAADRIAAMVPVVGGLKEKYALLEPHFAEIDRLEEQVRKLDGAVDRLDAYSRDIEEQFRGHFSGAPPRAAAGAAAPDGGGGGGDDGKEA